MRPALSLGAYLATVLSSTTLLLGKWLPKPESPTPNGPLGILQAFAHCPDCGSQQPHILHSTTCRTCQTCGHRTQPGDPT